MSDRTKSAIATTIKVTLYVCFVVLTIVGVGRDGWDGLCLELIGLAGVIGVVWWYNAHNR